MPTGRWQNGWLAAVWSKQHWQGRKDSDALDQQRWHQVVSDPDRTPGALAVGVLGYASDLGVRLNQGRPGAAEGPAALRQAMSNLPWHGPGALVDFGDIEAADELAITQDRFCQTLQTMLSQCDCVLGLGGSHDMAKGSYLALQALARPGHRLGIINIDAHLDLRSPAPHGSSGTPFWEVADWCQAHQQVFNYCCLGVSAAANTPALFATARRTNTLWVEDVALDIDTAKSHLTQFLAHLDEIYVTVCLDAFPAAQAPGVSAPAALGIDPALAVLIIRWLASHCQQHHIIWRLADLAEMNPFHDEQQRTARLAARLGFELTQAMRRTKG